MALVREGCMEQPAFLAAYGALWLEDGEPEQALIWLERSLLLDPHNLGAQADHALALAALGEPDGLRALVRAWQDRADIPPALRDKLMPPVATTASAPLPRVRLGGLPVVDWVSRAEATVLLGRDTNLDQSPRLDQLTLTAPEGPIPLPVLTQPRQGAALLADLSWQAARRFGSGPIVRTSLNLAARHAPSQSGTDWQQAQWTLNASRDWGSWRGQGHLEISWVGGRLSEPYTTVRLRVAAERRAGACTWLAGLEAEDRTQSQTRSADSQTTGGLLASACPLSALPGWTFGATLRSALDQPKNNDRPGGRQRSWSGGLRLQGAMAGGLQVDAHLRYRLAADAEGYSPLLENNARRRLNQSLFGLELSRPLPWSTLGDARWVLQANWFEQRSNLPLFKNNGASAYAGLRWGW